VFGNWKGMTVGLVLAGGLISGTALPAAAAPDSAARTTSQAAATIFEGAGVGPSIPIAVRRARVDAAGQAEAAGFDPVRCLEGTPDVDTIRPGRVLAFVDLFC
jgi:hypothetical protein